MSRASAIRDFRPDVSSIREEEVVDDDTLIFVSEAITELNLRDVPDVDSPDFSLADVQNWVKAETSIWSQLQEFYDDREAEPCRKGIADSKAMVSYWKKQAKKLSTLEHDLGKHLGSDNATATTVQAIAVQVIAERFAWLVAELEMIKYCPDKNVLEEHDILAPADLDEKLTSYRMRLAKEEDLLKDLPSLEKMPFLRENIKNLMWGLRTERNLI